MEGSTVTYLFCIIFFDIKILMLEWEAYECCNFPQINVRDCQMPEKSSHHVETGTAKRNFILNKKDC